MIAKIVFQLTEINKRQKRLTINKDNYSIS